MSGPPRRGAVLLRGVILLRMLALLVPLALAVVPVALRPRAGHATKAASLVVITPHSEMTRGEFGRAFAAWARHELDTEVDIDWRTPGGSADIARYLDDQYRAAFARAHPGLPGEAITDERLDTPARSDEAAGHPDAPRRAARAAFLAGEIGVGIDLFWGGGEFSHRDLARKGYLVDAGLLASEPDWFSDSAIPQQLGGETVYDPGGRYYGACLSGFGICSNPERLAELGLAAPPTRWSDLADPRLFGATTMADPSRSAAVASCIERLIQERMQAAITAAGSEAQPVLDAGWREAFVLLKGIAGNARAITDGASKAVRDVARGDAAAGMCIDFHARAEAEWSAHESGGRERLVYASAVGGTSISADPIALLRGAPDRALAVAFMRFVLSPEGQRLWNYRVGEPGGPVRFALRRWPVRRDVYTAADRARMSDPGEDPFALAAAFSYRPALTQPYYALIAPLSKALLLEPRAELVAAWRAILDAGGPQRVPEAMAELGWLPFQHTEAAAVKARLAGWKADREHGARLTLELLRGWTVEAQARYRAARRLAEAGR